jgi:hypothetical protein
LPNRAFGTLHDPLPLPAYRGDRLAFAPTPPGFGQIVLCRPDAWVRVSFAHTRVSIVGWIYDPDHSLPPGMNVDVPHLDCLLVAAPITLEGLDHLILKPKQLDGVVAVNVDEVLGHVAMALSKKSQAGKTSRNDLHRQEGLKLGPRLHGIYSGQSGIQCCLFKLVVEPWSQCLH